ncbi:uncharacterized protein LOC105844836 isoform X1 [Hydra vulgaris]|uniref:uncharacterized protein LOC105844836 isoform X1 n=1 Tax=Hydra vulgaris TaxID=6087 RepID=UPI001F5EE1EB|nr:uncharacterized protein LOC105844836 [Hydra vulgaris]
MEKNCQTCNGKTCKPSLILVILASICGFLFILFSIQSWSERQLILEARVIQLENFQKSLFVDKLLHLKSFNRVRYANDINFNFTLLKNQLAKIQEKHFYEEKTLKKLNRNKRDLGENDNQVSFRFQSQLISVCRSLSDLLKCSTTNVSNSNVTTAKLLPQHKTPKKNCQGSKGEKGEPGLNGQMGYNGLDGPRGKQGLKGDPGVCDCKVLDTNTNENSEKDGNNQKSQKEAFELVYTVWGSSTCPDTSNTIYSGQISMSLLAQSDGTSSGSNAVCLPISDRFFSKNFKTRAKKSISPDNTAQNFNISVKKEKVLHLGSATSSKMEFKEDVLMQKIQLLKPSIKPSIKSSIMTDSLVLKGTPHVTQVKSNEKQIRKIITSPRHENHGNKLHEQKYNFNIFSDTNLNDETLNTSRDCKKQTDAENNCSHLYNNDNKSLLVNESYSSYRQHILTTDFNYNKKVNEKNYKFNNLSFTKDIKIFNKEILSIVAENKETKLKEKETKAAVILNIIPTTKKVGLSKMVTEPTTQKVELTHKKIQVVPTKVPGGQAITKVTGGQTITNVPGGQAITKPPGGQTTTKVLGSQAITKVPGGQAITKVPGVQAITIFGSSKTTPNVNNVSLKKTTLVTNSVTGSKILTPNKIKLGINLTKTNPVSNKKNTLPFEAIFYSLQKIDGPTKATSVLDKDDPIASSAKSGDIKKTTISSAKPTDIKKTTVSSAKPTDVKNKDKTTASNFITNDFSITSGLKKSVTDPIKNIVTLAKNTADKSKQPFNTNNIQSKYNTNENAETNFAKLVGTRKYVPCALCQAFGKSAQIMIPSTTECPPEWNIEYFGYLMDYHHGTKQSQIMCVNDQALGISPESEFIAKKIISSYLSHIQIDCDTHPCNSNIYNELLKCVVCSK